jgi:hypothetical protein
MSPLQEIERRREVVGGNAGDLPVVWEEPLEMSLTC